MENLRNKKIYIKLLILYIIIILGIIELSGCAGSRKYTLNNDGVDLETSKRFYVKLNSDSEKVEYSYFTNPLNYDEYAKNRSIINTKPDVPLEILQYLKDRKKGAIIGPISLIPEGDFVVITYKELWGWDVGDIIKRLNIEAYLRENESKKTSVNFEEMTIFNTHPVAKSLVPHMMDLLFSNKRTNAICHGNECK
jgi:hypothetical protein